MKRKETRENQKDFRYEWKVKVLHVAKLLLHYDWLTAESAIDFICELLPLVALWMRVFFIKNGEMLK